MYGSSHIFGSQCNAVLFDYPALAKSLVFGLWSLDGWWDRLMVVRPARCNWGCNKIFAIEEAGLTVYADEDSYNNATEFCVVCGFKKS